MRALSLLLLSVIALGSGATADDLDFLDGLTPVEPPAEDDLEFFDFLTPVDTPSKSAFNRFAPGMRTADLLFLVDVTGSMGTYIAGVKKAIFEIVKRANGKMVSVRTAFIGYRDPFGNGEKTPAPTAEATEFEILSFTRNIPSFKNFVTSVRATGGGDGPEDVFGGLERVMRLDWDAGAVRRVLFHVADSPPHGSRFGSGGVHNMGGDPLRRSLSKLLGDIRKADICYAFGQVNGRQTDEMIEEFSAVWASIPHPGTCATIPQFKIQPVRRPAVAGGGDGWGGAVEVRESAEDVADKIVAAVGSLLDV